MSEEYNENGVNPEEEISTPETEPENKPEQPAAFDAEAEKARIEEELRKIEEKQREIEVEKRRIEENKRKLEEEAKAEEEKRAREQSAYTTPPQTPPPYTPYGYNGYNYQPVQQPPKKKSGAGGIIAVSIIVAVVAIVLSIVMMAVLSRFISSSGNSVFPDTAPETTTDTPNTEAAPDKTTEAATEKQLDPDVTLDVSGGSAPVSADTEKNTYASAAAKAVDSIVEIRTEQITQGVFMQQYISSGAGSGVIVTADGYIATNDHVVDGASTITVILRDGTEHKATLVGTDSVADIAVIKIEAEGLKPVIFGDSDSLIVAQDVLVIGNPLGKLGGSVTEGIISALERNIVIENQPMTLLQTTAAINPGNSGGGLFNLAGECVGIVNAKSSGTGIEGIGFAIPANTAVPVIQDLIKYGYAKGRVMLGITMLEIADSYTARSYGLSEYGVYIRAIGENSDAAKAGLKAADRLVSLDGEKVSTAVEVRSVVQRCKPGQTIDVVISRDGKEMTFQVTFSEYIPE